MSETLTQVAKDAIEEYQKGNVHITPLYPAVLIRVLPKPAFQGSIYIPDAQRNKPMYEGIVIQTYAPHKVSHKGKELILESELKPGDHVIFKYWSGAPIPGLNEEEYRFIPDHSHFNKQGNDSPEPLAILSYEEPIRERLQITLHDTFSVMYAATKADIDRAVDKLLTNFNIIPKTQTSKLEYREPKKAG